MKIIKSLKARKTNLLRVCRPARRKFIKTLASSKGNTWKHWQPTRVKFFIETFATGKMKNSLKLPASKRDSSKLRQLTREIRQNFGNRLDEKFIEPLAARKSKSPKLCYGFVLISTSARYGIRNMRLGSV